VKRTSPYLRRGPGKVTLPEILPKGSEFWPGGEKTLQREETAMERGCAEAGKEIHRHDGQGGAQQEFPGNPDDEGGRIY
jgi:hypothetical protein